MKCLVTGHSGLLGSHLVDVLLANGHDIYGISETDRNRNDKCHNYCLDLKDTAKSGETIKKIAPEIVYALAADASEGKSVYSPIESTTNNINVFFNTLVPSIAAGKLKRVVFTSSVAVYGSMKHPFKESDTPNPKDIYGISKLANENSLKVMSQVHKFEFVIVRPHHVFGPRQNMKDPHRNVVVQFMNHILKHEPYTIYGDGEMRRCFSYVKDVVSIIYRCGFENVAGTTFNVGSDTDRSINELSACIRKICRSEIVPLYAPEREQTIRSEASDHTLIKRIFGYTDTPFEHALQETWEWVQKQGPQQYSYPTPELPDAVHSVK